MVNIQPIMCSSQETYRSGLVKIICRLTPLVFLGYFNLLFPWYLFQPILTSVTIFIPSLQLVNHQSLPSIVSSNSEALTSELLENREEVFSKYYTHSNFVSSFKKSPVTSLYVTSYQRVSSDALHQHNTLKYLHS